MGIDILGIDIMGVDILGIDIVALPQILHIKCEISIGLVISVFMSSLDFTPD